MVEAMQVQSDGHEAYRVLVSMMHGVGRIAPELLAQQVMRVTAGGDWSLRDAAADAMKRRWGFARRDGLRVASRPTGRALGCYATRRKGSRERPYTTQLHGLDPLQASCDCPDFRQSALGLCKHVLVVLDDLWGRPRKLAAARRDTPLTPVLQWDPVRPLTGAGDWMQRVRLDRGQLNGPGKRPTMARHFAGAPGDGAPLRRTYDDDPGRRRELVRELLRYVHAGGAAGRVRRGQVDAALVSLLEEERTRLESGVTMSRAQLTRALRSLQTPLYRYQRQGLEHFLREGQLLLADDMGLGKTAQAIAACHVLHHQGQVKRGLLIVPAPLKHQWLREWQRFTDAPAQVVEGSPAERQAQLQQCKNGFLILNYELLLRDLSTIEQFDPQLVVLDEAQRIKNWATKTAAHVKRLSPPYRLVLTGTPMENRLEELASIMQWVDRRALEPAWRLVGWHQTEVGVRNLSTLRERLRPRMLRRIRQEVLDQLPARTDTRAAVELTQQQQEAHEDLDAPVARLVSTSQRRPLTQREFLRLMGLLTTQRMICNGLALTQFEDTKARIQGGARPSATVLRQLFSPKLGELRGLIESLVIEQRRRVVVFSQWRRMLELARWATADLLADEGLRSVFFTGGESQNARTRNVINFHDDDQVRVMFASDAGGVGLNLQRAASCCVNLELPWNPAVLEQRIGRVYRLGQTEPVEVYNLVSEAGIESRIATLVGNKRAAFEGLFDGDSDEVLFDQAGSFMERVEHLVDSTAMPASDGDLDEESDWDRAALAAEERAAPPPAEPTEALQVESLAALARKLAVRIEPNGGLRIDAPPEVAHTLAGVLEGLTAQLRAR